MAVVEPVELKPALAPRARLLGLARNAYLDTIRNLRRDLRDAKAALPESKTALPTRGSAARREGSAARDGSASR